MNWRVAAVVLGLGFVQLGFQNCTKARFTSKLVSGSELGPCNGVACSLSPRVDKPHVTTVLMALGDQINGQLVGSDVTNQYIVENIVRFTSPVENPKILFVIDPDNGGEDIEDSAYVAGLLNRYRLTSMAEPAGGLEPSDLAGYDLVWFNNPGYPFSSRHTLETLLSYGGGVVLQGDDMSWAKDAQTGESFSLRDLNGLESVDNGTSVTCDDGKSYQHGGATSNSDEDQEKIESFHVALDPAFFRGLSGAQIRFRYQDDIDNSVIAAGVSARVLAYAKGGPDSCTELRPAIVQRENSK